MSENKYLSGSSLAGGKGSRERVEHDYYATPPSATMQFLEQFHKDGLDLSGTILEPAAGGGHISEVLKEEYGNHMVWSTDIVDREYPLDAVKDFLNDDFREYDNIVTNPPFKYAQEFIEKGLKVAKQKVIMFAKIQLLEGQKDNHCLRIIHLAIYMSTLQELILIEMEAQLMKRANHGVVPCVLRGLCGIKVM